MSEPVCPVDFNFGWDVIADPVRADRTATLFVPATGPVRPITFAQLDDTSSRVAGLFRDLGLDLGDRVVMVIARIPAFYEVIVGAMKAGVAALPGTNLLTARDLAYRIEQSGARAIVVTPEHVHKVDAIASECPTLLHRIVAGPKPAPPGWICLEEALATRPPLRRDEAPPTRARDTSLVYFTSGTTAHPKAVPRDFAYGFAHRITGAHWMDLREGDVHWTLTDTGWAKAAWGLLFPQWSHGATTVLFEGTPQFDVDRHLRLIGQLGVTTFCAPPTVYRMFAQTDLSRYDLSSIRRSMSAGEPLNPEVIEIWRAATGSAPADGYGQTETINIIGNTPGLAVRPGSMGKPIAGFDVRVVDGEGREQPDHEVGEIAVVLPEGLDPRTASVADWPAGLFRGYEVDGERTTDCFHHGCYFTGDTAWRDEDGYIWFVGRSDDVISSGAYRISPFEVESVLQEHPAVAESAVVGKPDPLRGHIVAAFVVLADGHESSDALVRQLQQHCKTQTAPYKYPREILFRSELPKTISGKIRRVELRDSFAATTVAASQAAGPTDVPLLELTIGQALKAAVARWPTRDALIVRHQDVRLTYAELDAEVEQLARALMAAGFQQGDRLGIWSPNHAEWVLTQLATASIGVILVCVNPAYRTHEVQYALRQSGCRGLVAATTFKTSDYVAMVDDVRPALPDLEHVVFIGTDSWTRLVEGSERTSLQALTERRASLAPSDPINIQYTSGTTGSPKGATLTHRNILNNGYFVGRACGYTHEDRICIPVPFYHCFGMVMGNLAAICHGAAMVIPAPSFDPERTLAALAQERCTSLYGVPTMFIAQLAVPSFSDYDLSSLRTGIMAGAPCPVDVMQQCIDHMHMRDVTIAYGMTETSPVSTQTALDDPLQRRVGTVGRVHPHVEIRIVDPETGQVVPRGTRGELCTRGYSVMQGYWSDEARTQQAIDEEGWMHTGDLATMDAEGYVQIVGRIKDMVIRGGENIYPREVEAFLRGHPRIRDVQVIGVPDRRYGEELMAWVQTVDGKTMSVDDVRTFCDGRIAHFKVPRYVAVAEAFPMTVTGKVQKFKMREHAIEVLGLLDEAIGVAGP
ncbi:MAG: AMP-binding protein [Myxococcales bacterium]|nr:AMP-binding protein [Myxococcales bacterium]